MTLRTKRDVTHSFGVVVEVPTRRRRLGPAAGEMLVDGLFEDVVLGYAGELLAPVPGAWGDGGGEPLLAGPARHHRHIEAAGGRRSGGICN